MGFTVLAQYLEAAALPVVAMVKESEDQQKTWGRIFGSRRAKNPPQSGYYVEEVLYMVGSQQDETLAYQDWGRAGLPRRQD